MKGTTDCVALTLFSDNIQSQYGVNYWIPFTENEVQARSKFESNFMTDFIAEKIASANDLLSGKKNTNKPLTFSKEAKSVFEASREL